MPEGVHIAEVTDVPDVGSYLFTAEDAFTNEREFILVRCDDGPDIEAWVNNCTHENQRLDRGTGVAMRDGEIICPKHGSMFDACPATVTTERPPERRSRRSRSRSPMIVRS